MTEKRIRHLPVLEGRKACRGRLHRGRGEVLLSEQDFVISQQAYKIDQLETTSRRVPEGQPPRFDPSPPSRALSIFFRHSNQ